MKANELRIGNLCYYHVEDKIEGDHDVLNTIDYEDLRILFGNEDLDYQPIPLTEEWLLKFGFKCHEMENEARTVFYSKSWGINGVEIICRDAHYTDTFEYQLAKARYKVVEYVHQLQNLYFALTGEELTLNN